MTTSQQDSPRTNRAGDVCPTWCTTNHDELIIAGEPRYGYLLNHNSDYMTSERPSLDAVKVSRLAQEGAAKVRLDGLMQIHLAPEQADSLAQMLENRHSLSGIASLIDELRAAAQIARDTDTPTETHDVSVDPGGTE